MMNKKEELMKIAIKAEQEWDDLRYLYLKEKIDDIPNRLDYIIDRIIEEGYEKKSKNIINIPCNIHDTIYYIDKNYNIQEAEVTCIDIRGTSKHIIATRYNWETEETIKLALPFEKVNIDYWLKKEDAEKALKEWKK